MIKIHFEEPSSEEWRIWRERCQKATEILKEDRSKGKINDFNSSLYRKMKSVFFSQDGPFHGKRVYCESFIAADQPGDLDHFRPKAEVMDFQDNVVNILDNQGNQCPHPGYYWLAYDWQNLLPCCRDCNSPSKSKTNGKLVGKGCRFPVIGKHAASPGEEAEERPLLINPTIEDPSNHLEIDSTGIVISKSERGSACIEIFGLNEREALVRKRKEAFDDASEAMLALFDAARPNGSSFTSPESVPETPEKKKRVLKHLEKLNAFESGSAPYSASGRAGIDLERPICQAAAVWLSDTYQKYRNSSSSRVDILLTEYPEPNLSEHRTYVDVNNIFICAKCNVQVPEDYVKISKERGLTVFNCPCGGKVPLTESEKIFTVRS